MVEKEPGNITKPQFSAEFWGKETSTVNRVLFVPVIYPYLEERNGRGEWGFAVNPSFAVSLKCS